LITALASTALLLLSFTGAFAEEVDWVSPPFDDIVKKAQTENKHIFIDFYATWCGPCKRLEAVTYKDAKVASFLNSIVPVKYDAEKDEGEVLAKKFKVRAYPTLVLLDPSGNEVDRFVGYLDPEDFLQTIEGYEKGIGTVGFYEEELKKNPNDVETMYELGMKHADAVRSEDAKILLEKVIELDPDTDKKAEIWSRLGYVMYSDDRYEEAVGYYTMLIKQFPDTKDQDEALQMLAYVYYKMNREKDSLASYMKYLKLHPDDPGAMNGFAWFCAKRKFGFEEALPVALKAADLSDRDSGILDTLAELYYAMEDYGNAIKIGEEALSKEPDDQYLKDQLVKFRAASEGA